MLRWSLCLGVLCLQSLLFADTQSIYFKLEANSGNTLYQYQLFKFENANFVLLDSAFAKAGSEIKFEAKEMNERLYQIRIPNAEIQPIDFIVSPQEPEIHISGTIADFTNNAHLFSGSNENNCWQSLLNAQHYLKDAQEKNIQLIQKLERFDGLKWRKFQAYDTLLNSEILTYNQALGNYAQVYGNTYCGQQLTRSFKFPSRFETAKNLLKYDNDDAFLHEHFFDHFDFKDERLLHFPYLYHSFFTYLNYYTDRDEAAYKHFIDLLFQKEASPKVLASISDFLMQLFASQNQASLVQHLLSKSEVCADEQPNSISGDLSKVMPGHPALEVNLKDLGNKEQSLAALAKSKQLTALIFYSPTCPHCIDFFKDFEPIYKENKEKLGVYTVTGANEKEVKAFVKNNGYQWITTLYSPNETQNPYKDYVVLSTPTIVLIDKNMKIVSRFSTLETIKELLGL